MRRRAARLKPLAGLLLVLGGAAPLHAQDAAEWGFYSASKGATRYSPLAQIDESNVDRLRVVWRHKQADPGDSRGESRPQFEQSVHGYADLRRR